MLWQYRAFRDFPIQALWPSLRARCGPNHVGRHNLMRVGGGSAAELAARPGVLPGLFPVRSLMRSSLSNPVRALAAVAFLLAAQAVPAQALPPGVRLGMSADELQAALPGAERVPRPQRLAGGLAGHLARRADAAGGVVLRAGVLLRRRRSCGASSGSPRPPRRPTWGRRPSPRLVAWGRQRFGPELGSNDPGSAYAAWVAGRSRRLRPAHQRSAPCQRAAGLQGAPAQGRERALSAAGGSASTSIPRSSMNATTSARPAVGLEVGHHEGLARLRMRLRVGFHHAEVGADVGREVGLVDDEQVALGDAGAALARDLLAGRDVDHVDRQVATARG